MSQEGITLLNASSMDLIGVISKSDTEVTNSLTSNPERLFTFKRFQIPANC
jgi:hypothetical protein